MVMLAAAAVAIGVSVAAFMGFRALFMKDEVAAPEIEQAKSYSALGRTDVRKTPDLAAPIALILKEGTIVSAQSAGVRNGVEWLSLTAIDGAKGFAPKALFREIVTSNASGKVTGGVRHIVTSTLLNLRETPSMSGKIVGTVDGGTRLISDGMVEAEGELWLRIPLDGANIVYLLQRFTTADDDAMMDDMNMATSKIGVAGRALQIVNVQATPLPNSRVVRALQAGETVRVIGQTQSGVAWYVLKLSDGSQGFAPKAAISLVDGGSRWVYPDGSEAPGPNVPQGQTEPLDAATLAQMKAAAAAVAAGSASSEGPKANTTPGEASDTVLPVTPNAPVPSPAVAGPQP
ncbi:SH3 domain-containing protein [Candidatus Phycosocius bacilliformis]|nr:SH3 domain-containing protein [Candidatus Phycosocius bacilliformis]